MGAIVNSLLLLARADTGQMTLNVQDVDLSDVTLACVERLLSLARQQQITLATGALPELLVRGDPQYLGQMLTNIIENGVKYTSGKGTRVFVELAGEQGKYGVVRVQDDGPGISDEHLPYLFERFYRVDKARSTPTTRQKVGASLRGDATGSTQSSQGTSEKHKEPGGAGLGLSIAQWIAQAHGGEIRVESAIGEGALFEIRLPLLTVTERDTAA